MRILLTNLYLDHYAGTEVYVRDLAIALHKADHDVEVYSPESGIVAREIKSAGLRVANSIDKIANRPDIIHGQHFLPAMDAILRFPNVPAVYFVHDRLFVGDTPPKHSQVVKYVAVDHNCLDKLVIENEIPKKDTSIIYNWVDTNRFNLREGLPAKPSKALIFSNNARRGNYYAVIRTACENMGLKVDGLGDGLFKMKASPEQVIGNYDIVFAKAKAAMEAMATGAAVIVCDERGLGEMVTAANFDHFRKFNFGMRTMTRPITAEFVAAEIAKYDPAESVTIGRRMREEGDLKSAVKQIVVVYDEAIRAFETNTRSTARDQETIAVYREQRISYLERRRLESSLTNRLKRTVRAIDGSFLGGALSKMLKQYRTDTPEKLDQNNERP